MGWLGWLGWCGVGRVVWGGAAPSSPTAHAELLDAIPIPLSRSQRGRKSRIGMVSSSGRSCGVGWGGIGYS